MPSAAGQAALGWSRRAPHAEGREVQAVGWGLRQRTKPHTGGDAALDGLL